MTLHIIIIKHTVIHVIVLVRESNPLLLHLTRRSTIAYKGLLRLHGTRAHGVGSSIIRYLDFLDRLYNPLNNE